MKSKWIETTVGEIADAIQYGYTESSTVQNVGPKFLRITDIQNGKVDWQTVPYCKCDDPDKYSLQEGDILFARTGATTGKSFLIRNCLDAVFASYLIRVRLRHDALPNYVYQFFQTNAYWNQIKQHITGSTQGGFNASKLAQIKLLLPSLPIQKQVAAILEKADAAREKRRQANQLTEQFLQSAFLEIFGDPATNPKGWEVVSLQELGTLERGRSKNRPRNAPELLGGPYPLIQTGEIANSSGYIKEYSQTYSELGLKQSRLWPTGTLCITIAANIAKTAILTFDACFPDSIVGFTPNAKITTEYIQHWFSFIQKYLEDIAPMSAQKNINLEILRRLNVPLPPSDLQKRFAALVEKVKKLRARQRQSEQELEHLFHSLMQRAFRGELVD